jgi:hypothetical protein
MSLNMLIEFGEAVDEAVWKEVGVSSVLDRSNRTGHGTKIREFSWASCGKVRLKPIQALPVLNRHTEYATGCTTRKKRSQLVNRRLWTDNSG